MVSFFGAEPQIGLCDLKNEIAKRNNEQESHFINLNKRNHIPIKRNYGQNRAKSDSSNKNRDKNSKFKMTFKSKVKKRFSLFTSIIEN